jgi:hypothetical protein
MAGGRPRVYVKRTYVDYPAPTEVPGTGICRLWQGAIDRDGYGVLNDPKPTRGNSGRSAKSYPHRKVRAHRWVWEMANGPIPPGMVVRHKCDNRLCFKLNHLELGTVADNNADAAKRGHAGPVLSFKPSELEMIRDLHALGWTYERIQRERLPDRAISSIKRVGKVAKDNAALGLEPWEKAPTPPDPGEKYSAWRERKPL